MPHNQYQHLLFDLDHTLWDFDANARDTLQYMYAAHGLEKLGIPAAEEFIDTYTHINHALWRDYHNGIIDKYTLREIRFVRTFEKFGLGKEHVPNGFYEQYVNDCSQRTKLFDGTHTVLNTLLEMGYKMYIVSNGFEESVMTKMHNCKLLPYFEQLFISDSIGLHKPDARLFGHVLNKIPTTANTCLMIGDSLEADIRGAAGVGIDQVFFNTRNEIAEPKPNYEIQELKTLLDILA